MNKNQKIGIGCGAVGCLGLIVIGIAGAAFYFWRSSDSSTRYRTANRNFNFNINSNSNNSNSNSSSSDAPDSSSSYSDDDKHKLFQAAGMAKDAELLQRVVKKIGLFKADGTPAPGYEDFVKEHISWAINNAAFVNSINTPETARAYIDAHFEE